MPESDEAIKKARDVLVRLDNEDGRSDLIDRLSEFFPDSAGRDWLTDENRADFGLAFGADYDSGGWLNGSQYMDFWGYIRDYTQEGGTGNVAVFLQNLLSQWESAAAAAPAPAAVAPGAEDEPRFAHIDRVAGYDGWWQGYDTIEGVWKYVAADQLPSDDTDGWMISSVAFPEADEPAPAAVNPQEAAEAVFERVVAELTEPDEEGGPPGELTPDDRAQLWREVWAEIQEGISDWSSQRAEQIVDRVVDAYLTRLMEAGEPADELIAEIEAFIALLSDSDPA